MEQVEAGADCAIQDVYAELRKSPRHEAYYFTVDVHKAHGKLFGLCTLPNDEGLFISQTRPNSIASKWNDNVTNAGFPQDCVQPDDIIICVNGVRGTGAKLQVEMKKATEFLLVVKRQIMHQ